MREKLLSLKDASQELRDCVAKYREELVGSKLAIKKLCTDLNKEIDINKYFYKGDKTCNYESLSSDEQSKYHSWKGKIEETHASDLKLSMPKIKEPDTHKQVKSQISEHFKSYEKDFLNNQDFVDNTKNILKHIEVVDDSNQYNIDSSAFTFI